MKHPYLWIIAPIAIVVIALYLMLQSSRPIVGQVSDGLSPLNEATVRIKTTHIAVTTGADGAFVLPNGSPGFVTHVTAWKDGYYVGGLKVYPWTVMPITIVIEPYTTEDNQDYSWLHPQIDTRSSFEEAMLDTQLSIAASLSFDQIFLPLAERLNLACRDCHGDLIYNQWASSAHALGNRNVRFMTMYNGTDVHGNQSPLTEYITRRDYGEIPVRPNENEPYYGPGFLLDFPESIGNCSTCHLPTQALETPFESDPNQASGVHAMGSHCDFCHKIADASLNPDSGQPFENFTGVLSLAMLRPSPESQLFFGPYDDVDVGPDTYLPFVQESEYCAACHNASFWGVPIYQSFAEWQESDYAEQGTTCQDCHMEPDGVTTNFAPNRGGVERDPESIPSHSFPGASDLQLLQNTAELNVQLELGDGQIRVDVTVTNTGAGHHMPTDSPLRQIFLLVEIKDTNEKPLRLLTGPTLPEWAGDLAGDPGHYYAKILEQLWTEESPTGAYWTQTRILEDTRLAAMESDQLTFTFNSSGTESAVVEVRLVFRRAYYELMQQKGWDDADILMEHWTTRIELAD